MKLTYLFGYDRLGALHLLNVITALLADGCWFEIEPWSDGCWLMTVKNEYHSDMTLSDATALGWCKQVRLQA